MKHVISILRAIKYFLFPTPFFKLGKLSEQKIEKIFYDLFHKTSHNQTYSKENFRKDIIKTFPFLIKNNIETSREFNDFLKSQNIGSGNFNILKKISIVLGDDMGNKERLLECCNCENFKMKTKGRYYKIKGKAYKRHDDRYIAVEDGLEEYNDNLDNDENIVHDEYYTIDIVESKKSDDGKEYYELFQKVGHYASYQDAVNDMPKVKEEKGDYYKYFIGYEEKNNG